MSVAKVVVNYVKIIILYLYKIKFSITASSSCSLQKSPGINDPGANGPLSGQVSGAIALRWIWEDDFGYHVDDTVVR